MTLVQRSKFIWWNSGAAKRFSQALNEIVFVGVSVTEIVKPCKMPACFIKSYGRPGLCDD